VLAATLLSIAVSGQARAQHDHSQHAPQAEEKNSVETQPAEPAANEPAAMDHAAMGHDMPKSQAPQTPIEPIPAISDADRAAAFPVLDHHAMEHAPAINHYVQFNRLEAWDADHGTGQAWEGSAWIGSDLNRLWLRSEGERVDGRTEASDLEVMYGRSISPWWDVMVGVKQDFRPTDSQTWAALGVQGMAPYKFEFAATAYLGESGNAAATVEIEYELLLTNRLILQPLVELSFYAKNDPLRGIGSGLSGAEAGLRLRYELDRRFAPYVGLVHERVFGRTADYRRAEGEVVRDTRLVVGVRVWF
jgi:copper resistance protein B